MRVMISTLLVLGAIAVAAPARAQTYSPDYPVCLHVWGPVNYYECAYTSLAQCAMSASGRSAQCMVNPYAAHASMPPIRASRRVRPIY